MTTLIKCQGGTLKVRRIQKTILIEVQGSSTQPSIFMTCAAKKWPSDVPETLPRWKVTTTFSRVYYVDALTKEEAERIIRNTYPFLKLAAIVLDDPWLEQNFSHQLQSLQPQPH